MFSHGVCLYDYFVLINAIPLVLRLFRLGCNWLEFREPGHLISTTWVAQVTLVGFCTVAGYSGSAVNITVLHMLHICKYLCTDLLCVYIYTHYCCVLGKVIGGVFVDCMLVCTAVWGSVFLTLLNHPAHLSLMTIWGQK